MNPENDETVSTAHTKSKFKIYPVKSAADKAIDPACAQFNNRCKKALSQVYKEHLLRVNKIGIFSDCDEIDVNPLADIEGCSHPITKKSEMLSCHEECHTVVKAGQQKNLQQERKEKDLNDFYGQIQTTLHFLHEQDDSFFKWFAELRKMEEAHCSLSETCTHLDAYRQGSVIGSASKVMFDRFYTISNVQYNKCSSIVLSRSGEEQVGKRFVQTLTWNTCCGGDYVRVFLGKPVVAGVAEGNGVITHLRPHYPWSNVAEEEMKRSFTSGHTAARALQALWGMVVAGGMGTPVGNGDSSTAGLQHVATSAGKQANMQNMTGNNAEKKPNATKNEEVVLANHNPHRQQNENNVKIVVNHDGNPNVNQQITHNSLLELTVGAGKSISKSNSLLELTIGAGKNIATQ